jgi:hemoglobin
MTLYDRIGGAAALEKIVDRFYDRVLADPELAPFFEHSSMDKLRGMQREFLGAMLGGPMRYTGSSLSQAHAGRGITLSHYRRFADHFLDTLQDMGVAKQDMDEVLDRLNMYADDIRGNAPAGG